MFEKAMTGIRQPRTVRLRPLSSADAPALYQLVQRNAAHLSRFGDYEAEINRSLAQWREQLESPSDNELTLGLLQNDDLIGCVALISYQPAIFGLGYWISAEQTGQGYVTESCQALIDYARDCLGAEEIWAGIRAENAPSIAVAEKLGLCLARQQPTHLSYLLRVGESAK